MASSPLVSVRRWASLLASRQFTERKTTLDTFPFFHMTTSLIALFVSLTAIGGVDELTARLELEPKRIQLGELVYSRVTVRNEGEENVTMPSGFARDYGNLRFDFWNGNEDVYRPMPSGTAGGMGVPVPLLPGKRVVLYDAFLLPRWNRLRDRSWPTSQASYTVRTFLRLSDYLEIATRPSEIGVISRPEADVRLLEQFYDGGPRPGHRVPQGWDWHRPTLGLFGLGSIPSERSDPQCLRDFEAKLPPGTLQRAVRLTLHMQDLYVAKSPEEATKTIGNIEELFSEMGEIEQHWLAWQLVNYAFAVPHRNYLALAERLLPRAPQSIDFLDGTYREHLALELAKFRKQLKR